MSASVKIMLSYDYCHFEICKGTDREVTDTEIDEMRKDCQRLADKAVKQYQVAKKAAERQSNNEYELRRMQNEVNRIRKKEGDLTSKEMAILKAHEDKTWESRLRQRYDYEDDYEELDSEDLPF
jgi:DNA polymerase III delta prime subunit